MNVKHMKQQKSTNELTKSERNRKEQCCTKYVIVDDLSAAADGHRAQLTRINYTLLLYIAANPIPLFR